MVSCEQLKRSSFLGGVESNDVMKINVFFKGSDVEFEAGDKNLNEVLADIVPCFGESEPFSNYGLFDHDCNCWINDQVSPAAILVSYSDLLNVCTHG